MRLSCADIFPIGWSAATFMRTVMIDSPHYKGASNCSNASDPVAPFVPACAAGEAFYCPDDPLGLACFGMTGEQILRSVGVNYAAFSADDE